MGTVKCHGTTTSLQGVQPDWPYAATRLTAHRFRSCQLRQCNNWSLVHLVTAVHMLTWLYIYIYMHVCVSIYKKGVDYLCSYITHLKKKFILGSHIITITYLNVSKSTTPYTCVHATTKIEYNKNKVMFHNYKMKPNLSTWVVIRIPKCSDTCLHTD